MREFAVVAQEVGGTVTAHADVVAYTIEGAILAFHHWGWPRRNWRVIEVREIR